MRQAGLRFPLAVLFCVLLSTLAGLAQTSDAVQVSSPRHVPVFGNADEFAVAGDFQDYIPLSRVYRDIDLQVTDIAVIAHMRHGWEFQFDGMALRARGSRLGSSTDQSVQAPSNAAGLAAGPLARWNFLQFSGFRTFVEAEGDFVLFDRPFPALGTFNDFFLRAGGGVSVRVSDHYWVESTFHFAHISNGECCVYRGNPTWQGKGLALGLRRSFGHAPDGHGHPGVWPFRYANENAWTTNAEDYTPAPGLNRKNGGVIADMRELRISRSWHFPNRLELQLGGMTQTTHETVGFGPALRWNFIESAHWRPFVEGGLDVLQSGSPGFIVPWKGVGYNGFLRGRGGVSFRLRESYWLEAGLGWAHVTSGGGWGNQLLPWSGQGAVVGLRHTFGMKPRF